MSVIIIEQNELRVALQGISSAGGITSHIVTWIKFILAPRTRLQALVLVPDPRFGTCHPLARLAPTAETPSAILRRDEP